MKNADWDLVKHFKPSEFQPRPDMMHQSIVFLIDTIRDLYNAPIHITSAWAPGTGHSATSQHYVGKAVDFWVQDIPFKDAVDLMEGFISQPPRGIGVAGFIGLGIYVKGWAHPGFHLDTRGSRARWGWTGQYKNGKMLYVDYEYAKTQIR